MADAAGRAAGPGLSAPRPTGGGAGSWAEIEYVVFDLDGVLVDSRAPIAECLNRALVDAGLAPEPEAALHPWIGVSLREVFQALLRARDADPERAPELVEGYRRHYGHVSIARARTFPGMEAALRGLARRARLAVATSKPEAFARPILEALGLASAFAHICGPPLRDTHLEDKTATLGRALDALGVARPARAAAMVGDRRFDVLAGRHHGTATVGVTWGIGEAAELTAAGADRLVHAPGELAALLGAAGD